MKESPVFPGVNSYDFDVQKDFKQFLEEARRYANEKKVHPLDGEESGKNQVINQEKKKGTKKSWKTALFSFWRSSSDKKTKQLKETFKAFHNSTNPPRQSHVSGPIYGVGGAEAATGAKKWHRLAASGPLTNLFHHQKKWKGEGDDIDVPYVSLDRLNKPEYDAKSYGPVYLVS